MSEMNKNGGAGITADRVSVQEELLEKPLGDRLREKRVEQDIALDDVAHQLKVESSVLLSIEDGGGPPHGLPDVFYKGFIRNYARYLGVEIGANEVQVSSAALDGTLLGKKRISTPSINLKLDLKPVVEWIRSLVGDSLNLLKNNPLESIKENPFPLLATLLLLVALVWWLSGSDQAPEEVPVSDEVVAEKIIVDEAELGIADEDVAQQEEVESSSAPVDMMAAPRGVVTIRYIDGSWTQVKDGMGRVLVKRMLDAGAIRDFKGPLPLEVKLGNAIGVRVKFNGKPFDHLNYIDDNNTAQFILESGE